MHHINLLPYLLFIARLHILMPSYQFTTVVFIYRLHILMHHSSIIFLMLLTYLKFYIIFFISKILNDLYSKKLPASGGLDL